MTVDSKLKIAETENLLSNNDIPQVFTLLADQFRQEKKYAELFEILKSRIRLELSLPLKFDDQSQPPSEIQQRQLEDRMLDACLEVGKLLVQDGRLSEGWLYLQPVLDRQSVKSIIAAVDITDENISDVIEVALCQWAAPEFGYRLLLENQGTCNGITFFDTQITYQDKQTRQQLAEILVQHLYRELVQNITAIIRDQEPQPELNKNLLELIRERSWLFENCGHHLDVTHLASVVRIARECHSQESLQKGLELAQYGTLLDHQLHYESEPPFENLYEDHQIFFSGLVQQDSEKAIGHFEEKCKTLANTEFANVTRSVLMELLVRTGQSGRALSVLLESPGTTTDLLSELISVAHSPDDFDRLMSYYKEKNDLFGFGLSAIHKSSCSIQKKPDRN